METFLNKTDEIDISILSDFSQADLEDLIQTYGTQESENKPTEKMDSHEVDFSKMDSINNLLNGFSEINLTSMLSQNEEEKTYVKAEEINLEDYFDINKLKDRKLSRDDMITVSLKEPDGSHKAVFASLGDIVDFIYEELKKKDKHNG